MHSRITFATSRRVLQQLSHDKRTLALIFVVPCVLLGLLAWMFGTKSPIFQSVGAPLLGIFPFVVMFLVTSITTLRERRAGTLELLLTLPTGRLDILLGYAFTFGFLAVVQALLASSLMLYGFGLDISGPQWFLVLVAVLNGLLGTALGLFVSAFARTEFQAMQFLPAFYLPQMLLCGLFQPLTAMPDLLEVIARCLPLTYAVDAMQQVTGSASLSGEAWRDIGVILGFAMVAIIGGALTLRRQTK